MLTHSEQQPYNTDLVLRLMPGLYEFEKRVDELNRFGMDLFELAPITDLVQATYMAIGAPSE